MVNRRSSNIGDENMIGWIILGAAIAWALDAVAYFLGMWRWTKC